MSEGYNDHSQNNRDTSDKKTYPLLDVEDIVEALQTLGQVDSIHHMEYSPCNVHPISYVHWIAQKLMYKVWWPILVIRHSIS